MFERMRFRKKLQGTNTPKGILSIAASCPADIWRWEQILNHRCADKQVVTYAASHAPVDILGSVLIHEAADDSAKGSAQARIDEAARRKEEEERRAREEARRKAEEEKRDEPDDDYDDCGCNSPGYGCTHR